MYGTDHVWLPSLGIDTAVNAPPEVFFRLALPCKDTDSTFRKRSGNLILCGVDVAGRPSYCCSKSYQCFYQHLVDITRNNIKIEA